MLVFFADNSRSLVSIFYQNFYFIFVKTSISLFWLDSLFSHSEYIFDLVFSVVNRSTELNLSLTSSKRYYHPFDSFDCQVNCTVSYINQRTKWVMNFLALDFHQNFANFYKSKDFLFTNQVMVPFSRDRKYPNKIPPPTKKLLGPLLFVLMPTDQLRSLSQVDMLSAKQFPGGKKDVRKEAIKSCKNNFSTIIKKNLVKNIVSFYASSNIDQI